MVDDAEVLAVRVVHPYPRAELPELHPDDFDGPAGEALEA